MQERPDVCIAGAGIIGLALALELNHLGASVCVLERDTALSHASQAAAGMLAAHDPENSPALLPLSELSLALYPDFLRRVAELSGQSVPFQTDVTYQGHVIDTLVTSGPSAIFPNSLARPKHSFVRLVEHSMDPRQLAPALLAAVRNTSIELLEHTSAGLVTQTSGGLHLQTAAGSMVPGQMVYTLGCWSFPPVRPRKGQMLAVRVPPTLDLEYVVRTPEIYIVPRTVGPNAGCALIGATVEDAGFSVRTDLASLAALRGRAARLIPALADEQVCPMIEAWAGLRPDTPDHLPLLGALPSSLDQFVATGHYRNGILLAPATAHVMAHLLAGTSAGVALEAFCPARFENPSEVPTGAPIFAHRS